MALDKTLKIRLSDKHIEKAERDNKAVLKLRKSEKKVNVSEHIRELIVRFDIVDYKRDLEMGLIDEEE